MSTAQRRLLERLKLGAATPAELAEALEVSQVAARQHLRALEEAGLVAARPRTGGGRGRPSAEWRLTEDAQGLFPDRHSDLTVELIDAARDAFGEEGLNRLVERRSERQIASYGEEIDAAGERLGSRVRALARRRTAEGYMAEAERQRDGSYLLIERHCPICDAAKSCRGLCRAEQEVFQTALGKEVQVERTEHLLSGGERCVYRIEPR